MVHVHFNETAVVITNTWENRFATPVLTAQSLRYNYISEAQISFVQSAGGILSAASYFSLGFTIGMNLIQSSSTEALWLFISMLQILFYIPAINCDVMPYNLEIFLTNYLNMNKVTLPFNILPDWVPNPSYFTSAFSTPPYNQNFMTCGYVTVSFIYNFSSQLMTWFVLLMFYAIIKVVSVYIPASRYILRSATDLIILIRCGFVHRWKQEYEYNVVIRVLIESQMDLIYCSLLNLAQVILLLIHSYNYQQH